MYLLLHRLYCTLRGNNRGFGIHSPLAYKTVRDAVSCRYGRYAYHAIEEMLDGCGVSFWERKRLRHKARLLVRVAIFFGLHHARYPGQWLEPECDLLSAALESVQCSQTEAAPGEPILLVGILGKDPDVCRTADEVALLSEDKGCVAYFCGNCKDVKRLKDVLCQKMGRGIIFDGAEALLVLPNAPCAFVKYKIKL